VKRFLLAIVLLVGAPPTIFSAEDIRLPSSPLPIMPPDAVQNLSPEKLYVIDSDVPLNVIASPQGIVSISTDTGPVKVRAKFIEGEKLETRTFSGKFVYTIEVLNPGTVEIIIVAQDNRVIRRTLKVGNPTPVVPIPAATFGDVLKGLAKNADPGSVAKLVTILTEVSNQDYTSLDQMESTLAAAGKKYLPNGELQPLRDAITAEITKRKMDIPTIKAVYKEAVEALK
jgi:hypothetical protein